MRSVVNSSEVAHLWANATQEYARNGSDSFSFQGDTIYSYNTPIAKRVVNGLGQTAFLVGTRRYSMTTSSKHQPAVRRAIPDWALVFYLDEVAPGGMNHDDDLGQPEHLRTFEGRAIRSYQASIVDLQERASRARQNKAYLLEQLQERVAEAKKFCQFFGIDGYDWTIEGITEAVEVARAQCQAERAERERLEAIRAEERAVKGAGELERWRAREQDALYYARDLSPAIRLSADDSEVETSWGARVPVHHAWRLWVVWTAGRYEALTDARVGHYTVREASQTGITIGCHELSAEEIARFAQSMGWEVTSKAR